jgi:hypothetical protein
MATRPAPESREITGTPTTMLMMAVATPPPQPARVHLNMTGRFLLLGG